MARRSVKSPTKQRKVTIPPHVWALLEHVADLHCRAYVKMGGDTRFTVSDLLELGAEYLLRKIAEDVGTIPPPTASATVRDAYAELLAEDLRKRLMDQLFADPTAKPKNS